MLLLRHCQPLSSGHLEARKFMCLLFKIWLCDLTVFKAIAIFRSLTPSEAQTHNHNTVSYSKGRTWEGPEQGKACNVWDKCFAFTLGAVKADTSLNVCLHLLHKCGYFVYVPRSSARYLCLAEWLLDEILWFVTQDTRLDDHNDCFWS